MKKTLLLLLLPACFAISSCGGKDMDETSDGSDSGPEFTKSRDEGKGGATAEINLSEAAASDSTKAGSE